MSTSVITTRTGLISDLGRTSLVVELQHHRLRLATRLSLCRDWVVCITATQSRPNNFQLRTELFRCQDRREISRPDPGSRASPARFWGRAERSKTTPCKALPSKEAPPASKTRRRLDLMNHSGFRAKLPGARLPNRNDDAIRLAGLSRLFLTTDCPWRCSRITWTLPGGVPAPVFVALDFRAVICGMPWRVRSPGERRCLPDRARS